MSLRATRKRARTGSVAATDNDSGEQVAVTSEAVGKSLKRDEEFWYEDGNITLVARDIEFRVFKGILAKHSPVFKDVFSLPQPQAAISSFSDNGCPVVYLSDSPEDLRHVLRAYMPTGGPSAFFHKDPPYSYDAISAAVRLGHKYQMSDLLDNALRYLKAYYPTDFDQWRKFDDYGPPGFDETRSYAIGIVNLARLTGETGLLLMALLVCCTIPKVSDLIRGFEREDGSREQLSLDDIALCVDAKSTLTELSVKIMLGICRQRVSLACQTAQSCSQAFKDVLSELEATEDPIIHFDPSVDGFGLREVLEAADLCLPCQAMVNEGNVRERKAAWDRLETIFDIDLTVANEEGQAAGNAIPP